MTDKQRQSVADYLEDLQKRLIAALVRVNGGGTFEKKSWDRPEGGGGTMAVLRGENVEKAGVNKSVVHGASYPAIEGEHKGKPFKAMGVSTITHMANPFAPIGHMNVRLLEVGDTFWFGGGADLTPCFPFEEDTKAFHAALRAACDKNPCGGSVSYEKFTKWCDEYFFIPHRKEVRGVGGIFFDYLKGDFDALFAFLRAVGDAYADVFPKILAKRKETAFTPADREKLLYWRGRYAEYNLIYDRGTKFGLMTGGNIEAIFVSLPPVVKW
jgi:coproporphyrinogen III oxidase